MNSSSLYFDYAHVLVFFLFGILFVILNVSVLSRLLRPFVKDPEKETTYECGEPPVGSGWVRFDMRFYTVALVFLIFDVELALLFPWGVIYREFRHTGFFIFAEMGVFVAILMVGLVYVWVKGDLDWIKSVAGHVKAAPTVPAKSGEKVA